MQKTMDIKSLITNEPIIFTLLITFYQDVIVAKSYENCVALNFFACVSQPVSTK